MELDRRETHGEPWMAAGEVHFVECETCKNCKLVKWSFFSMTDALGKLIFLN